MVNLRKSYQPVDNTQLEDTHLGMSEQRAGLLLGKQMINSAIPITDKSREQLLSEAEQLRINADYKHNPKINSIYEDLFDITNQAFPSFDPQLFVLGIENHVKNERLDLTERLDLPNDVFEQLNQNSQLLADYESGMRILETARQLQGSAKPFDYWRKMRELVSASKILDDSVKTKVAGDIPEITVPIIKPYEDLEKDTIQDTIARIGKVEAYSNKMNQKIERFKVERLAGKVPEHEDIINLKERVSEMQQQNNQIVDAFDLIKRKLVKDGQLAEKISQIESEMQKSRGAIPVVLIENQGISEGMNLKEYAQNAKNSGYFKASAIAQDPGMDKDFSEQTTDLLLGYGKQATLLFNAQSPHYKRMLELIKELIFYF